MKLPEFAVKRPVTVTMIALALLIFGFISLSRLGLGFIPNIEFPITAVIVPYPGADTYTVEEQITKIVEPSLRTISGVNQVMANSGENLAIFIMEFKWGTDLKEVSDEIRSLLDFISISLPKDAGKPIIFRLDPNQIPLAAYSISAKDNRIASQWLDDILKPALESVEDVARVAVIGKPVHEVEVAYYPDKLKEHNIAPQTLGQLISYQNIQVPAGQIEDQGFIYNLRTGNSFTSLDELKELVVGQGKSETLSPFLGIALPRLIKLGEVASIEEHYRSSGQIATINGSPTIMITVYKAADANTVKASREVVKKLKTLENEDIKVVKFFDQSEFIEKALETLALNGLFGGLLAVAVLYLFLRNWRTTIITAIAIPFSVVVTFAMMYAMNININLISLGGLALGMGMLVDNSIVVIENIYRKRQEGLAATEAAIEGTSEVGMAITTSTLTTLVVFLPVVFMNSLAGNIFRELALTVSFSLASSLLVALTIVPFLASRILNRNLGEFNGNKDHRKGFNKVQFRYQENLKKVLQSPAKWLIVTAVAVGASLLLIPVMNFEMLPEENMGQISVTLKLPAGTPKEQTLEVLKEVEPEIIKLKYVDKVYSVLGTSSEIGIESLAMSSSDSKASLTVLLETVEGSFEPTTDTNKVADNIREILKKAEAKYPNLETKVSVDSILAQVGLESGLTVRVKGVKDEDVEKAAASIMAEMKKWPELASVSWSYADQEPIMELAIDPSRVLMGGQVAGQVAMGVRQAIVGEPAGQIILDGLRVPVVVKAQSESVKTLSELEDLYFPATSPTGTGVTLGLRYGNVIEVQKQTAPRFLQREGGTRVIEVTGIPATKMSGKANKKLNHYLENCKLPASVSAEIGGIEKIRVSAYKDLFYAGLLALALVYMVMASQFEGLLLPLIIMFTMPLALIGSLVFLFIFSRTLSIPAIIGMIVLAGIVVNNGIVLVDYINQLRKKGLSVKKAIQKGSTDRLRPILMTALTTILGLLPMALNLGSSTKMQVPMALTVMGGLITSTFLTLYIIPSIYMQMVGRGGENEK